MFLKIEFSDQSTVKDLSDYQTQEAKVTDDRLKLIMGGNIKFY